MQTLVQVICTKGGSMRDEIANNVNLEKSSLEISEMKRQGRRHGWTKVHSTLPDRAGAINIEWDADTNILICRIVTRGKRKPGLTIGDFIGFLLDNFKKRIIAINIIRR